MPRVIVFDLNETLIDMSGLDPEFARVFGKPEIRKDWFKQVLQLFLTATVVGKYRNFEKLADSALKMVGTQQGMDVSLLDRKSILVLDPDADQPDIIGDDLRKVVEEIIEKEG